jgi:Protein of unknown function (DUF1778)
MTNQNRVLKLNAEDSRAFAEAILNPKEPNTALKKAFRKYQQAIDAGELRSDITVELVGDEYEWGETLGYEEFKQEDQ